MSIKSGGFISLYLKLDSQGRSCLGHAVVDQPLPICGNSREVQDKEDYDDLLIHYFGTGQQAMALVCWAWRQQEILHCCSAALTRETKLLDRAMLTKAWGSQRISSFLVFLILSFLASFHESNITSSSQSNLPPSFCQLLHLFSPFISTSKHWWRNADTTVSVGGSEWSSLPIWMLSYFLQNCPFCIQAVLHWVHLCGLTANGFLEKAKQNLNSAWCHWAVMGVAGIEHLELIQRSPAHSDSAAFSAWGARVLQQMWVIFPLLNIHRSRLAVCVLGSNISITVFAYCI